MKDVYITRSIEKLSHFNCGSCKKWWSVGDASVAQKFWFCPWCGLKQQVHKPVVRKVIKK